MKVHILTKVIGNHTEIINTYADEEKAWDYIEKEAEKHGDKVYDQYIVESMPLIK